MITKSSLRMTSHNVSLFTPRQIHVSMTRVIWSHLPLWWNWKTRKTKDLVSVKGSASSSLAKGTAHCAQQPPHVMARRLISSPCVKRLTEWNPLWLLSFCSVEEEFWSISQKVCQYARG